MVDKNPVPSTQSRRRQLTPYLHAEAAGARRAAPRTRAPWRRHARHGRRDGRAGTADQPGGGQQGCGSHEGRHQRGRGIAGFAIESARDLVQYMVKRGQMTPEEADKLIREAEAAHDKRPASEKSRPTATKIAAERAAVAKAEAAARAAAQAAAMPPFRPSLRPMAPPPPPPGVAVAVAVSSKR